MPTYIELVEVKPNGNIRACLGSSAIAQVDGRWNAVNVDNADYNLIERERAIRPYVVGFDVLQGERLSTARVVRSIRSARVCAVEHATGRTVTGHIAGRTVTGYFVIDDTDRTLRYIDHGD